MNNQIGCYIRLSHADDGSENCTEESNSVVNQRELLRNYIADHPEFSGWEILEFVDDGYSGTSENRPAFKQMISLVQRGQLKCIIVKDFSRFARNYITTGEYLEQLFPIHGVRFISINDNYDSARSHNTSDALTMALKGILNSYYSKDLSAKMFSSFTQRMQNGSFVGTPCFGYVMNAERTHFVVDPEAAKIVRHIFDLAIEGKTRTEIVNILNEARVPTPAVYNRQRGFGKQDTVTTNPLWDHVKVSNLLRQEVYTGKLIMRRKIKTTPCTRLRRSAEPSEQIIRDNAHEAIVSQEEFDLVQTLMPKRQGWDRKQQRQYPLKGLVRCGGCGKVMSLQVQHSRSYFQCPDHQISHALCSRKKYSMEEIEQAVFCAIQQFLNLIIQEEKEYRNQNPKKQSRYDSSLRLLQREKDALLQKKRECYEAYVSGELALDQYTAQKNAYAAKGQELTEDIQHLEKQKEEFSLSPPPADLMQAVGHAREHVHCSALTREMALCFIQSIHLHETRIEINWTFNDLFERLISQGGAQ